MTVGVTSVPPSQPVGQPLQATNCSSDGVASPHNTLRLRVGRRSKHHTEGDPTPDDAEQTPPLSRGLSAPVWADGHARVRLEVRRVADGRTTEAAAVGVGLQVNE